MDRLEEYNIECMLINDNQAREDELIKEYERNNMNRLQEPKVEKVIKMRDATPEEQEAIDKYIKSISKPTGINVFDFYEDEEKSCNNCKHHLKFMCKKWETCHDYSDWELNELDFVQPKKTIPCTVKIQEQSKTKFWDLDDNDDCISRKAVLSLLADHFDNIFDMVKELPSVDIPNKVGCWIFHEIEDTLRWYECDQCGAEAVKKYDYCHGCGAKMESKKNE